MVDFPDVEFLRRKLEFDHVGIVQNTHIFKKFARCFSKSIEMLVGKSTTSCPWIGSLCLSWMIHNKSCKKIRMYDRAGNSRTDRTLSINDQNMPASDRRTPQHLVLWGKTQLANGIQFVGTHNYTPLIYDVGMPVLIQLKYRSMSQPLTQPSRCSLMQPLVNVDSLIIFHQPFKPPHQSPRLSPYHHFQMEWKSISCSPIS